MVDKLLKVENWGKLLLRIGIAIYMWSVVLLSFKLDKDNFWLALVMAYLVIIPGLSLLHFKNPKTGLIGGIGTAIFFLGSALVLIITDLSANVNWTLIYLHIVKDLLLLFGSIILIGESIKEMIREKITAPFPKK
jgi:uncharacterized membrane protein YkgB